MNRLLLTFAALAMCFTPLAAQERLVPGPATPRVQQTPMVRPATAQQAPRPETTAQAQRPAARLAEPAVARAELLPETKDLIARMKPAPNAARVGRINTLINGLKDAGVWSKLDVFYVLAAHNQQAARLNWKGNFAGAKDVGKPNFAVDKGFQGDGRGSYLDIGDLSAGPNMTRDSAMMAAWSLTDGALPDVVIGGIKGYEVMMLSPRIPGDTTQARLNDTSDNGEANSVGKGFFAVVRSDANTKRIYRDGVQLGPDFSVPSVNGPPAGNISIGAAGGEHFSNRRISAAFLGGALRSEEVDAAYRVLRAYLQTIKAL